MRAAKTLRWEPAIYEHKAALIGKSPAEVAVSEELLVAAIRAELQVYRADAVTVGLDIYNIEAEALGATVTVPDRTSCPEVAGPIYDLDALPESLSVPEIPAAGRFGLVLGAGLQTRAFADDGVRVRVAATGPVTLATRLVGTEPLLIGLLSEEPRALRLLEFTTAVAMEWCRALRESQLDVIVFDSSAAPPMLSPQLYERYALPVHRRLMEFLATSGQSARELVIGGDTVGIASLMAQTGATTILCDYAADAAGYADAVAGCDVEVRRNADPSLIAEGDSSGAAVDFAHDLTSFHRPIAGTGILPYGFEPEAFHRFRAATEVALASRDGMS